MDLALNNLVRLICHKAQQTKPNQSKEVQNWVGKVVLCELCKRLKFNHSTE